jgi:hypothetical protein
MGTAGFNTPVEDRNFEDYVLGSVHEFGMTTIDEGRKRTGFWLFNVHMSQTISASTVAPYIS